jgi:hypothetical protein
VTHLPSAVMLDYELGSVCKVFYFKAYDTRSSLKCYLLLSIEGTQFCLVEKGVLE